MLLTTSVAVARGGLLARQVVGPGWVSETAFYAGMALTQSLPGPLFNFASYLGTVADGVGGGLVAVAGLFGPGCLLILAVGRRTSLPSPRPAPHPRAAGPDIALGRRTSLPPAPPSPEKDVRAFWAPRGVRDTTRPLLTRTARCCLDAAPGAKSHGRRFEVRAPGFCEQTNTHTHTHTVAHGWLFRRWLSHEVAPVWLRLRELPLLQVRPT